ncbi:MAG TPA: hypothetical protein DDY18_02565 [Flavobacterium sp.]|nr:hypothetical protein [Flavobacterium sp.]
MTTVTAEVSVNASVKMAYRAFTNSTSLREWLCDVATVSPHVNGRMYLWWVGDFYSSGHYLELDENKKVKFRWFAHDESAPTEVTVTFEENKAGVKVKLEHAVPDGASWKEAAEGFKHHWSESLENLKSILETGIDLRISTRPMLGIVPGDFTDEQAKALGVPTLEGLRLDGLVDGMGAQQAGLQKDDVLIGMAGKEITSDFNTLVQAIAGKKGGDTVEVNFYRGAEKKNVMMTLSKRPMPNVPFNPKELAKQARELIEPGLAELEKVFEGYTDEQAMKKPDPKEWSALEVVAHLIHNERGQTTFLASLIDGYELITDGFGNNITQQVEATVKAYPSIKLMLEELRRSVEEVLLFTEMIPQEFTENKGSYYRFASGILQPNFHINAHLEQIINTLEATK